MVLLFPTAASPFLEAGATLVLAVVCVIWLSRCHRSSVTGECACHGSDAARTLCVKGVLMMPPAHGLKRANPVF